MIEEIGIMMFRNKYCVLEALFYNLEIISENLDLDVLNISKSYSLYFISRC